MLGTYTKGAFDYLGKSLNIGTGHTFLGINDGYAYNFGASSGGYGRSLLKDYLLNSTYKSRVGLSVLTFNVSDKEFEEISYTLNNNSSYYNGFTANCASGALLPLRNAGIIKADTLDPQEVLPLVMKVLDVNDMDRDVRKSVQKVEEDFTEKEVTELIQVHNFNSKI